MAHFALLDFPASTRTPWIRYLHAVSVPAFLLTIQLLVLYFGKWSAGLT
jgi:hypothetical protein